MGDEVFESEVGQNAHTATEDVTVTSQRDDGTTHPQSVQGDGVAGEGKGVEDQIDILMSAKIRIEPARRPQFDTVALDSPGQRLKYLLVTDQRGLNHQPRIGDRLQNL